MLRVVAPVVRASPARSAIRVDGRLDEPAWRDADSIATLVQVVCVASPRRKSAPWCRRFGPVSTNAILRSSWLPTGTVEGCHIISTAQ